MASTRSLVGPGSALFDPPPKLSPVSPGPRLSPQVMKIAVAPTVMFLELAAYRKVPSPRVVASVMLVCVGVGAATVTDSQMARNAKGLAIGLAATLVTAMYQVCFQGLGRICMVREAGQPPSVGAPASAQPSLPIPQPFRRYGRAPSRRSCRPAACRRARPSFRGRAYKAPAYW